MEGSEHPGFAPRKAAWRAYEHGPEAAYDDTLFAGFFVPAGSRGRLTHDGSSRSAERLFLDTFSRSVAEHRLNSSGLIIPGVRLPMRILDYRPPEGFAEEHDYDSFSALVQRWAQGKLGVIWGTLREDGRIDRFEVAVDPNRYRDGLFVEWGLDRIRRVIESHDLPHPGVVRYLAKALAAIWCQGHCHTLNTLGRWRESVPIVADSERLVREALDELAEDGGPEATRAVDAQRKVVLPAIIRQEAASLWFGGERVRALEKLLDALRIYPFSPFGSRERFREYYNNRQAQLYASKYDDFRAFLAARYGRGHPTFEQDLAPRYAERALIELTPVDLELFVDWTARAAAEGVDLADKVGVWFSRLTSLYPADPFIRLYWGDALKAVTIAEHGEIMSSPDARLWDPVAEKYKRAYALDPTLAVAAVRAGGVLLPTAYPVRDSPEGERRQSEAFDLLWEKGKPFYERYAPWALEGGRGTADDLAEWVGQLERELGEEEVGCGG